jgi:hypothetical protein
MCRRNQLLGIGLLGLGLGLLIGCQTQAIFWCSFIGVAAMALGVVLLQRVKA